MIDLRPGDCRKTLEQIADNSVDSGMMDPPYALVSIVKRFGKNGAAPAQYGTDGRYARASAGFMGKSWDTGETAFDPAFWAEVLRVLKPGAHLLAFGGTRSYHRLACAIEDAGFEIRDQLAWVYGSGFPKSHDVSKGIDRELKAERSKVRETNPRNPKATGSGLDGMDGATRPWIEEAKKRGYHEKDGPIPATAAATAWSGWGTALKPAWEPLCLARKPLSEKTIAANVLRWGTGALNIDGCRIESASGDEPLQWSEPRGGIWKTDSQAQAQAQAQALGRWPANIAHDGRDEVLAAFPEAPRQQRATGPEFAPKSGTDVYGDYGPRPHLEHRDDGGSAARFFYTAKADKDDRWGSKHPTVKPIDLLRHYARLITPPGGTVLDCFAGSGTTGVACLAEGFNAILCEREEEYLQDIRERLAHYEGTGKHSVAAKNRNKKRDEGPLFNGTDFATDRPTRVRQLQGRQIGPTGLKK